MGKNKSPSFDGIKAGILRQAWPVLYQQIMTVFNNSLRTSRFPSPWKNSALVVIKNQRIRTRPSLSPISLLPVLSKALEHVIVSRIRTDTHKRNSTALRKTSQRSTRYTMSSNFPTPGKKSTLSPSSWTFRACSTVSGGHSWSKTCAMRDAARS